MPELMHSEITGEIIQGFYQVYNALGFGFLEKVYENALALELRERGLVVVQQKPISVYYKGVVVGEYFADLLVSNVVLVELKAASRIIEAHEAQLLNYLRATNIEVGLLLNFGERPDHKRKLYTNNNKPLLNPLIDE